MSLPVVGEALPKRNLPLFQPLARFALARFGWRTEGELPNLAQFVAVGAPHTSSWDFFLAMMLIIGLGVRVSWMGKASLFRWPLGGIMRWLGGIAINRTSRHNVVEQTIQHFATHPQLIVGLMPEGTRKRAGIPVKEWKTGFYYIAQGVQVPILPIYIDNPGKRVIFGPSLMPTGDLAADLATLQQFYRTDRV
jgi:1-acyl-sn-glycerol-3-phosphate acyltransferase